MWSGRIVNDPWAGRGTKTHLRSQSHEEDSSVMGDMPDNIRGAFQSAMHQIERLVPWWGHEDGIELRPFALRSHPGCPRQAWHSDNEWGHDDESGGDIKSGGHAGCSGHFNVHVWQGLCSSQSTGLQSITS